MMNKPSFKIGDHVDSLSGLTYQVLNIERMGNTWEYTVRRCKGGKIIGATRRIRETALFLETALSLHPKD